MAEALTSVKAPWAGALDIPAPLDPAKGPLADVGPRVDKFDAAEQQASDRLRAVAPQGQG